MVQRFKLQRSGLKEVNKSLGTNYQLSKIYFVPSDSASDSVYKLLIALFLIIMEMNSRKSKDSICEMIFGKVTKIKSLFQNQ